MTKVTIDLPEERELELRGVASVAPGESRGR